MWRDENPDAKGNIRDEASLRELIVLVNLESMNVELIKLGLSRADRAVRLNKMAIEQLRVLNESDRKETPTRIESTLLAICSGFIP